MLLHLDCSAGISGPATLAALAHLGVDFEPLAAALARAGLPCGIEVVGALAPGGPGCRVNIHWQEGAQQPCCLPDFTEIFSRVDVRDRVRQRALAVALALAESCAHARQLPVDAANFVDVVDAAELGESWADGVQNKPHTAHTLIHILGVAYGLDALGVERLTVSPLPWFTGSVTGCHGIIPLPRPATAFLMRGKPVFATDSREELVTPTGAALVHGLADEFVSGPQGTVAALGTGYGPLSSAGGLRAWLVDQAGASLGAMSEEPSEHRADHALGGNESVIQLESHIDHLNGEDLGMALTALSAMTEVLDVLWLPGVGKKNRPAGLLRVLCLPEQRRNVADAVLRHTHTLGLRVQCLERMVAPRHAAMAEVAGQRLPAKEYVIDGQTYVRPEADALEAAARQRGVGVPALRNARVKGG
ncbi:MAG: DUF111 family protein [Desulfovibrio sp.]|uniref:LarC family nickel insertion protein n=1 Tax=Desulfovibrio sp. TaxID=885 RepID=UPI00135D7161|nr:LarC family nickel insertion protein [Desulfovibrio sp.]MTJ93113.1 DUF111 family protein [Desulfovibrio sp.]